MYEKLFVPKQLLSVDEAFSKKVFHSNHVGKDVPDGVDLVSKDARIDAAGRVVSMGRVVPTDVI